MNESFHQQRVMQGLTVHTELQSAKCQNVPEPEQLHCLTMTHILSIAAPISTHKPLINSLSLAQHGT